MKIMLVDDSARMRNYISNIIRENGNTVIECNDGSEAVKAYVEYNPDCVLMDIKMKKLNGIEATKLLIKQNPNAKIIILTSYDAPEYRKASLAAGAIEFVSKKDLSELCCILNNSVTAKKVQKDKT
ncbi:MAG: response regulator transcription factor [Ignavibacteria bacterium]|jgi:two-component system chemotaxis response regulator CheY